MGVGDRDRVDRSNALDGRLIEQCDAVPKYEVGEQGALTDRR
jgi:hypothetical protein